MALDIAVDVGSPIPPYEQIRSQIAGHVGSGLLTDGARLPTIRALAADLGVAPGTVARAYTELEAAGLVVSRRRVGTVVVGRPASSVGQDRVRAAAGALARAAREDRVDDETVLAVVRTALQGPPAPDTATAAVPEGTTAVGPAPSQGPATSSRVVGGEGVLPQLGM
ncbi:GntR family transcriptional regulator [uncultured Modestobacter sp.]|uniref:GntR family transcriptional regulator n=1 Tax=uncultured Modestobacter sp. TaxID=380048 RepID=UPI00261B3534|nr:GntR family transcriptional regulator [uncultured Modestobacter sp.]